MLILALLIIGIWLWQVIASDRIPLPSEISVVEKKATPDNPVDANSSTTEVVYAENNFGQGVQIVKLELPVSWKVGDQTQDQNTYRSSLIENNQTVGELILSDFVPALGTKNITTPISSETFGSHTYLSFEATAENGFGKNLSDGSAYAIKHTTDLDPDFIIVLADSTSSDVKEHILKSVVLWSDSSNTLSAASNTNNWTTYSDENYGFGFKYPNSWRRENTGEGLVQLYSGPEAPRSLRPEETKLVVYYIKQTGTTLETLMKSSVDEEATITSSSEITIADKSARKYTTTYESGAKITLVGIQLQDDSFFV